MKSYILNKIIQYTFYTFIVFNLYSCENSIEIDLPDDQINSEDVFKDINTTKSALASIYINVRQNSIVAGDSNGLGVLLGFYTDELVSLSQPNSNNTFDFYNNSLQAANTNIKSVWNLNYNHIYTINAFIEGVTGSKMLTLEEKNLLLGEAYFIRSMYYQYLTQIFGNIPYITTTNYRTNSKVQKKSTDEILAYIQEDLKQSIDLLPLEYSNTDRIYPNKVAAKMLLAKNYLLQKKYDLAQELASQIVNNSSYKLEFDLSKTFKKNSKSTIWQLTNSITGSSTLEATTYLFKDKPSNLYVNEALLNAFDSKDQRLNHWLKKQQQGEQIWYHPFKYKNSNGSNSDEYSIVFRIEEAYFVLIESLIYQNKIDQAVTYLNIVRQKSGLIDLPLNLSKQQTIDELLLESQREFFCEQGHRFLDLKRNNKLSLLSIHKPNWKLQQQLWPLPENEILLNNNLLPQNDGY